MQAIIATVGTSLLTNRDSKLPAGERRPWAGRSDFGDWQAALRWMHGTDPELVSAETNTVQRLNPTPGDRLVFLHSDTPEGRSCAALLQHYYEDQGQRHVEVCRLPGVTYDLAGDASALEQMASQIRSLVEGAMGLVTLVTLAATGGYKAETMIMALVGQACGVNVCYVHELYSALVYLPHVAAQTKGQMYRAVTRLPPSGTPRDKVVALSAEEHHRPRAWNRIARLLAEIPWVDHVRFDSKAFGAPRNGIKASPRKTGDGRIVLWGRWEDSEERKIAVAIETTGHSPEHEEAAAAELRERLGRLF